MSTRLLFVYGPPAVGKLTIAEAVAERTGFKLLHNHAVIDAVTPLFEFGTDGFFELVGMFRNALYATAARKGVSVITTYGYTPDDEAQVKSYVETFREHGGEVLFVQLVARRETLMQRVALADRHEHGKLVEPDSLAEVLNQWDFCQAVPDEASLVVDTDALSADQAADQIIRHFGLNH